MSKSGWYGRVPEVAEMAFWVVAGAIAGPLILVTLTAIKKTSFNCTTQIFAEASYSISTPTMCNIGQIQQRVSILDVFEPTPSLDIPDQQTKLSYGEAVRQNGAYIRLTTARQSEQLPVYFPSLNEWNPAPDKVIMSQ